MLKNIVSKISEIRTNEFDQANFTKILNKYYALKLYLDKSKIIYESAKKDYKRYSIPDENGEFPLTLMSTKELRKRAYKECKRAKTNFKKANSSFSKIERDIYEFAGVKI